MAPPDGAAAVNITVPVPDCPLTSVLGLTPRPLRAVLGGLMVTPAVLLAPEYDAVIVAGVDVLTVPAVTVNVAEVAPCATVTLDGTLAAPLFELDSETTAPLEGAAPVSVTVPVADCPLAMLLGLTVTPLSVTAAGLIVTPNVLLTPA